MKVTLNKEWPYQLLFLIAVAFSYINNYEISLSVWLIILAITIKRYYSKSIIVVCSFFALIVFLGLLRSFYYDYNLYDIIRDFSYFIKPIVGLLIGYQCFRSKENNFFNTVIYTALIIAVIHLLILANAFLVYRIRYVFEIRGHGGFFSDFETFALLILIFHKKFQLNFSLKKRFILISIIGFSLCLYLARTNMIQFVIIFCGMLGLFQLNKLKLIILTIIFIIGSISYKIIYDMNPSRSATGFENFLYKIKNAPKEIYDPYVVNDNSPRFHDNFRSYETKITIQQVKDKDNWGLWLGKGLGATVNYGVSIWTNDGYQVRHSPILHNGFTTIFLKTGIIGLIIYISSIVYLASMKRKSSSNYLNNMKLLLNSSGIFLFISSLVFLGLYLKLDNKSLFIGGLIAYYELISKNKNLI